MYAILDIETTGGKFNEEGITEIAIYKFDGHDIVDQFSSLVNPEIPIQPFVVNLTGINNKMLKNAPKFFEVAKRIIEITEGCTVVAHNTSFDYRIIKMEFERLGYKYERNTLDTVPLTKELIPDLPSYSLGKLCKSLGIAVHDRHRATGDAMATVSLFKILLNKDTNKKIIKRSTITEKESELTPKLISILRELPVSTGVYYMHNKDGNIIYIGRSNNIKKRVNQHFLTKTPRAKKIHKELSTITYEETGTELISILKEHEEVLSNKTSYNTPALKSKFVFGLYSNTSKKGFIKLSINRVNKKTTPITRFITKVEGEKVLNDLINKTPLNLDNVEEHNININSFIEKLTFNNRSFIITDKGRNTKEKSVILVEKGKYKGFAFIELDNQMDNIEILKTLITPVKFSIDSNNIIQRHIRNKKIKVTNF